MNWLLAPSLASTVHKDT